MGNKVVYFCDKCHKEFETSIPLFGIETWESIEQAPRKNSKTKNYRVERHTYELCEECYRNVTKNLIKEGNE